MKKVCNKALQFLGQEYETNNCGKCFIIDYKNSHNVLVMFYEPVCIVKTKIGHLRRGGVDNPMFPSLLGKGFIGVGRYGAKDKRLYRLWSNLLIRVYCEKHNAKHPAYKDVTVCEEWLNFQNFAEWCEQDVYFNLVDEKGIRYQLDKDILVKGNKIYSPETCCFVPSILNSLIVSCGSKRGVYPVGVSLQKHNNTFLSQIRKEGSRKYRLGSFSTPEEAFQAYKESKELYIKEVVHKWKGKIDDKVYQALCCYKVEITD